MFLAAASASQGSDSTLVTLLTIFGGALVAAIAGLSGAVIQARRDHRRWLRERRYEAFVRAYSLIKAFDLNWSKTEKLAAAEDASDERPELQALLSQADALYATVADALAPLVVLGPGNVAGHIYAMQRAYEAFDKNAFGEAEGAFVAAARAALKIK